MHQLSFQAAPLIPAGTGPTSVILADLNNDSKLDLISVNATASTVSVSFGNGTGGFGLKADYPVGTGPSAVVAADFDRDGWLDLAVTNFDSDTVSLLKNNRAGGFTLRSTLSLPTDSKPTDIVFGNFNSDTNLDIAVVNTLGATVSVGLGDGAGTFTLVNTIETLASPVSITVGRFNADNFDDFAIANLLSPDGTPSALTIAFGSANGVFTIGDNVNLSLNAKPNSVATGDFNKDGKADLVTANEGTNTISVAFGDGLGKFTVAAPIAVGNQPGSVLVADFNADGNLDVATANLADNNLSIALGNGLGQFTHNTTITTTNPVGLATGDLNGDGKLDLVTANQTGNGVSALLSAPERSEIYWSNTITKTGVIWNQTNTTELVAARFLTYGKGIGDSRVGTQVLYDPAIWRLVNTVDMNGDGVRDMIYTRDATDTEKGEIRVLTIGQFNGQASTVEADREFTFANSKFGPLNGQAAKHLPLWSLVGVEDMSGDGQRDFVFYSRALDLTVIWMTDKSGLIIDGAVVTSTARPNGQETGARNAWKVQAMGDFTGDGQADILWRRDDLNIVVLWEMKGTVLNTGVGAKSSILPSIGSNGSFQVKGVGDFNNDGIDDIVWRNQAANLNRIWTFGSNGQRTEVILPTATDSRWEIVGAADMNRDGTDDIIWRDNVDNTVVVWGIKDATLSTTAPGGYVRNYLPGGNQQPFNPDIQFKIVKVTGVDAPLLLF
jgi:FG-GAP-like repeat/FG-GAP repeat